MLAWTLEGRHASFSARPASLASKISLRKHASFTSNEPTAILALWISWSRPLLHSRTVPPDVIDNFFQDVTRLVSQGEPAVKAHGPWDFSEEQGCGDLGYCG
ncbi:uncharacterized protein LACBIDRAFT_296589 [Laccaria bicolor S238N-H82]|uniref:Predicted protein n=1 Tax=Laccaria bicolor (strain S238N-H82 / ATCC MYA-4686) TaxID=486041 RepID=B0D973_LACBS|nr:uncharacterized protein LACBIDRAFT_296589 [Laccaria bicolor S238N-H82]EDR08960.1 predicted protein [Laccaria bicolor S238N-H82]|eukprot:XP_001880273.1 predicted protein [Laccaria bicolor S238N-H82]